MPQARDGSEPEQMQELPAPSTQIRRDEICSYIKRQCRQLAIKMTLTVLDCCSHPSTLKQLFQVPVIAIFHVNVQLVPHEIAEFTLNALNDVWMIK
jgi:hypothetical protein